MDGEITYKLTTEVFEVDWTKMGVTLVANRVEDMYPTTYQGRSIRVIPRGTNKSKQSTINTKQHHVMLLREMVT